MKSRETKISQFYDVLDDENAVVRKVYEQVLQKAKDAGFIEIETSSIELRERYLNATNVHFSKIFEVRRPKQGNAYALEADLAMSMSRFIADLPNEVPYIKLIQLGKMYRDRVDDVPGYRREFKQILLGEWGSESIFADAEVIFLAYNLLKNIDGIKVSYIEISNPDIFNVLSCNLAEKIRFDGIEKLEDIEVNKNDTEILESEFKKKDISFHYLESLLNKFQDARIKKEIEKAINLWKFLVDNYKIADDVFFSFKNLEGTGHYDGMHYKIYVDINNVKYLICDGGRINNLCSRFNKKKNIPAVCMGIGIQILAQLITEKQKDKVCILIDENEISNKWDTLEKIKKKIGDKFDVSIVPKSPSTKKKFFKNEMYEGYSYILIEKGSIEIRSNSTELKKDLTNELSELVSKT